MQQELHPALTASGRFKVKECLGQGGFGVVFSAFDSEANANVAIKWLRNSDASTIARFKREFRSLTDLVHPNLIGFRELINVAGEWFLTMDLVDGVDLLHWVRPASPIASEAVSSEAATASEGVVIGLADTMPGSVTSPLAGSRPGRREAEHAGHRPLSVADLPRVRSAFEQLASGLVALHNRSMLHRDVKPSNVLVARDGRVVLLDFGLVTEMSSDGVAATVTGNIVGTPAYMSPEQSIGAKLTPASDWYAVGVMLYQALTKRVPFEGEAHGVLLRKQLADPPPPSDLVRGIPRALSALCQEMIARAPEQRPSGPEIIERLRSAIGDGTGSRISALGPVFPSSSPGPGMSGAVARMFVGRETHLWALDEALEEVTRGGTVVALVHGPSGIGKSALVKHYLDTVRADRPDVVVLEGRCYERESVPYKALDSLIDSLCRYLQLLPDVEAAKLLPRDVAALARVFPVFRQFEGSAARRSRARSRLDAMQERRRAFEALRELFARIADRSPLVLSIDDLQWGDGDSEPLLLSILRPPDPPALLLLAAYRSEDAEASPLVKALRRLATSGPPLEVCEVPVAELSPDAARELALSLLGPDVASDRAAEIAEEARGSPLFLRQLAALGTTGERIDLRNALEKRVSGLPAPARRLLETLAVSGRPLALGVAARAAGIEVDPQGVLNTLRGETLVRKRGTEAADEVEVYHDRIREIVAATLSEEELRLRHQRLARVLSSTNDADAEALAAHFLAAGEPERAAEYAERAAERAETALAFTRAAEMYEMALELGASTEGERSEALVVKLAEALVNAGRGHEAGARFLQAAKGAAATNALDLRRRAAEQFLFSGHIEEGMRVVEQILKAMRLRRPKTPLGAVLSLAWRRLVLRVRGLGFRERSTDSIARDRIVAMDTCYSVGIGLAMIDPIRGSDFQTRYLLLALRAGEPLRIARGLALEAAYRAVGGASVLAMVDKLLARAKSMADRAGNAHARALAALMHGISRALVGDYERSVVLCDEASVQLRENCTGVAWELDNASFFAAFSLAQCGRLKELGARLPGVLEDARSRGDQYSDVFLRLVCTYLVALSEDDAARAEADLDVISETWSVERFLLQHAWRMVSAVDLALYRGDGEAAWRTVEETWPKLTHAQLHRVQSMRVRAGMARGRAALATGRLDEAEKQARMLERERFPVARGLSMLLGAGLSEGRGDTTGAVAAYGQAAAVLEEQKARLWAWAALHRRGALLGGPEGERIAAQAEEAMKSEGIVKPSSMVRMFAPVALR